MATVRFGYDGTDMIAEYSSTNALQRRYVFGPGTDEPLVWYEGSGATDRRWLHADERGSITAIANASGATIAIDSYDEYGMPATGNVGRFQYTGQMWLAETGSPPNGLYYYKARLYAPRLGRFLQTDPIGYGDGMNWYNYVGSDPVNRTDASGLGECGMDGQPHCPDIVVRGKRLKPANELVSQPFDLGGAFFNFGNAFFGGNDSQGGATGATPQKVDPKPKPLTNIDRKSDGTCPGGSRDVGRAGCLTDEGKKKQDADTCRLIGGLGLLGSVLLDPALLGTYGGAVWVGRGLTGVGVVTLVTC